MSAGGGGRVVIFVSWMAHAEYGGESGGMASHKELDYIPADVRANLRPLYSSLSPSLTQKIFC